MQTHTKQARQANGPACKREGVIKGTEFHGAVAGNKYALSAHNPVSTAVSGVEMRQKARV
jgi:hypothetical protein